MAYTRYYESTTSGLNFDRFVDRIDESTLTKMRQQYWTAKQLIRKKLGKKEDEYLLASDAEFDTKIALFRFIQETSEQMLCCIDDYQHYLGELIQVEFELSKMLKKNGEEEMTAAGGVMLTVGKVLALSAHHRLQIRNPLLRFFGELHVFAERAIADCNDTVTAAEKARTEYRGSLLWMKKASKELDPDAENALEKFRTAQSVVRRNKERLDGLKLDTLQKVDLLAASRCNLFSQLLESYQKLLYSYYEQATLAYEKIYDFVSSYQHYKFEILKDLIEPLEEPADENDVQIAVDEQKPDSLIEFDGREREMEHVLQDLERWNKRCLFDDTRIDSPLGSPNNFHLSSNNLVKEEPEEMLVPVGPLSAKELANTEIPAIAPPPGWKPNRDGNRYTSDLMDLLALDDSTVGTTDSFASNWSKLMECSSPTSLNPPLTQSLSTSSSALPSQLLDLSSVGCNFPNPFAESTDLKFDLWKGFLNEFETADASANNNVFKNC